MTIGSVIFMIVFCAVSSFLLYGIYLLEDDRDKFRKKYGYDPKRHGWKVDDDTNKDQ